MSYSVNTFMPIEGYRLAFNGTKGRLEVRDYERQPWDPGEETEMYLIKNFGKREKIDAPDGDRGPRRRRQRAARPGLQEDATCPRTCGCPTRAPARCRA